MTLGEAEWLELRLEVDGLGCGWEGKQDLYQRHGPEHKHEVYKVHMNQPLVGATLAF